MGNYEVANASIGKGAVVFVGRARKEALKEAT